MENLTRNDISKSDNIDKSSDPAWIIWFMEILGKELLIVAVKFPT